MDQQQIIERLTSGEFGGRLWQSYGKNRIYFNGKLIAERGGLEWSTYNTGNISSASVDGDRISNSECRRIFWALENDVKIWYDLDAGGFQTKGETSNGYARDMIAEFIADAQAAIA